MNAYQPVNRIAEYTHDGQELFEEHPLMTVAIVFGLGVSAGVAVASLFLDSPSSTSSSRYSNMAHRVGEQVMDAVSASLPQTLRHVMGR